MGNLLQVRKIVHCYPKEEPDYLVPASGLPFEHSRDDEIAQGNTGFIRGRKTYAFNYEYDESSY